MSASIATRGTSFQVTAVRPLFNVRFNAFVVTGYAGHPYDVAPDGRFLAIVAEEAVDTTPIRLVINWPSLFRQYRESPQFRAFGTASVNGAICTSNFSPSGVTIW